MPKYQFKAVNMSGRMMEGIYEAVNENAVIEMIRQKNFYHLEVKEIVERKDMKEIELFSKIKSKTISIYCRQFSSILKAGMPLIKCLGMLADQTENKSLKGITKEVCEEVQKGSSLSQAMSMHSKKIPPILINMIEAGEASGTLEDSFEVMAEHFEKESKTQQKIKSALRYPFIVLTVAIAAVVIMLTKVVPKFQTLFSSAGADLPLPTKILISSSDFFQKYGLLILIVIGIMAFLFFTYISSEVGRLAFDKLKFRMPIIGKFLKKAIAYRFARTMSTLMMTGVQITEALEITGNVIGNAYARKLIGEVIEQVKQGKGLYAPMKSLQLFPTMLENMIMMGEETGTLDNMLLRSAIFYEDEVDRATQNLTSILEPLIIVFVGGIVAFIVFSIVLPMFDTYNLVGQA
jgi:type IV pilus assembly protein PilC